MPTTSHSDLSQSIEEDSQVEHNFRSDIRRQSQFTSRSGSPLKLSSLIAHVILERVAECLLELGTPQPYIFEREALCRSEYAFMEDIMLQVRKDLANMCLVHSTWLASAQRVLQRRLVLRSFKGVRALASGGHLIPWSRSLRFSMKPGESLIQPLTDVLGRTTGLRLLSIDLKNLKRGIISAPAIASLSAAIGELEHLEGLIVLNISIPIARALLKPLFLGIRGLRWLRYIGLGLRFLDRLGGPPISNFSPAELTTYHNPPNLNTVAFWNDQEGMQGRFLDHLKSWKHSPESGPDVFELKRSCFSHGGIYLSLLVITFMKLLRARRLFVTNMRYDQALSPSIEELFVEFESDVPIPPGEQVCELISSGKLSNLRSIGVSSMSGEESDEFEEARALCTRRGWTLEAYTRSIDMIYIDELLLHARSFEAR